MSDQRINACIELMNLTYGISYVRDATPECLTALQRLLLIAGLRHDDFDNPNALIQRLTFLDRLEHVLCELSPPHEAIRLIALRIRDPILRHHAVLLAIDGALNAGDVAAARAHIDHLPDVPSFGKTESTRYRGFRRLLERHAKHGEPEQFLLILKQCEPRKDRQEIADAKARLIAATSQTQGLDAALTLARRKEFGAKFLLDAVQPHVETLSLDAMQALLANPQFHEPKLLLREQLTMLNWVAHFKHSQDGTLFDRAFAFADQFDPSIQHGDAKMRDGFLYELGMASAPKSPQRLQCRNAIKNASIKREMGGS